MKSTNIAVLGIALAFTAFAGCASSATDEGEIGSSTAALQGPVKSNQCQVLGHRWEVCVLPNTDVDRNALFLSIAGGDMNWHTDVGIKCRSSNGSSRSLPGFHLDIRRGEFFEKKLPTCGLATTEVGFYSSSYD